MAAEHLPEADSAQDPNGPEGALTGRLEGLIAGDDDARRWLHETFAPRLSRRLRARYARHRRLDIDELLQDTFLFYYQHSGRTFARFLEEVPERERSEARLDGYLWDMACGIASNRLRSTHRRPVGVQVPVEGTADPVNAERQTLHRDLLTKLKSCVKREGSRSYLYYKLRFVDGFTPEEISLATGWSRKITYKLRLVLDGVIDRCARRLGLR